MIDCSDLLKTDVEFHLLTDIDQRFIVLANFLFYYVAFDCIWMKEELRDVLIVPVVPEHHHHQFSIPILG